jgi:hypothetical protein
VTRSIRTIWVFFSISTYENIKLTLSIDGYSNGGGGFSLTQDDSVKYLQGMASAAAELGLSTGLKNAQEILTNVIDNIQFAVNEQCVTAEDTACGEYQPLLSAGKPVLHIEYIDDNSSTGNSGNNSGDNSGNNSGDNNDDNSGDDNNSDDDKSTKKKVTKPATSADLSKLCVEGGLGSQLSTVVKYLALDGWVEYCDGTTESTAINKNFQTGDPKQGEKRSSS